LTESEIQVLLKDPRFDQLTCVSRAADTYIVQKDIDKGTAVKFLQQYLGCSAAVAAAIGDSTNDIPMLMAVEHAYAPANCSTEIRALARSKQCRIMRRRFQSGLLEAVEHRVGRRFSDRTKDGLHPRSIMRTFLQAADRPFALHVVVALFWWNL